MMRFKGIVTGIYKIEDVETGRVYVGSANGIAKRWSNNLAKLRRGVHPYFQEAWDNDPNRIKFEILEVLPNDTSDEELGTLELQYFDYIKRVDGWTLVNKQTHRANRHRVKDTSKMKKSQSGIGNGNCKLKLETVQEILFLKEHGWKPRHIAEKYNVKARYITAIGTTKWTTVTETKKPEWYEEGER